MPVSWGCMLVPWPVDSWYGLSSVIVRVTKKKVATVVSMFQAPLKFVQGHWSITRPMFFRQPTFWVIEWAMRAWPQTHVWRIRRW